MRQIKFSRELASGIQTLLLHKLRSFLTMLGVVFGVGSVVAMLAVGEGPAKRHWPRSENWGATIFSFRRSNRWKKMPQAPPLHL